MFTSPLYISLKLNPRYIEYFEERRDKTSINDALAITELIDDYLLNRRIFEAAQIYTSFFTAENVSCSCLTFLLLIQDPTKAIATRANGIREETRKFKTGFCPRKPNKNFIALQTTMAKRKNNFPFFFRLKRKFSHFIIYHSHGNNRKHIGKRRLSINEIVERNEIFREWKRNKKFLQWKITDEKEKLIQVYWFFITIFL